MTDELAKVDPRALQPKGLTQAMQLADIVASIGYAGHKSSEIALICIIAGSERGFSAVQSLTAFHVINGKASLSADAMLALASQSPDCEWLECIETTPEIATWQAKKHGRPAVRLSFTIAEAKQAGLLSNNTWKKYPSAMLRARAGAAICRMCFPAAVHGLYIHSEMEQSDASAEVVEAEIVELTPSPEPTPAGVEVEAIQTKDVDVPDEEPTPDYGDASCEKCGAFTQLKDGICVDCSLHVRTRNRLFDLMNESGLAFKDIEYARKHWVQKTYNADSLTALDIDQLREMGKALAQLSPETDGSGDISERAEWLMAWGVE